MIRLSIVLVLAALAGACSRGPTDPALVQNPAPLTDCGDDAFISILGGGRAVVCRGDDADPAVRACIEATLPKGQPYAHVNPMPNGMLITVSTPEQRVYQVRRMHGGPDTVDLVGCVRTGTMPPHALPYGCPTYAEGTSPVARGPACRVLERARSLRREHAELAR